MTKVFSAQADAARLRAWSEIVYLLELTLYRDKFAEGSAVSTILRISDAYRQELGQEWLPLVKSFGAIEDALGDLEPDASIGTLDVELFNTVRVDTPTVSAVRFTDLVRAGLNGGAGTYDIAFADVTLYILFKGGASGDQVQLVRLQGEEVTDVTPETCRLKMSGIELSLDDAEDLYRVDTNDFQSADPDSIGEPVPLVVGPVTELPGLGLVAGIVHKLAVDIPANHAGIAGALPVSDPELLARMPDSGLLQIDDEQFTYTGRNITAALFTGAVGAANGTQPAAHNKGAAVFQVLSEYVYAVAANPGAHGIRGVLRVRSDGALVDPASYTVQLANTTLKPGRSLVVVRFAVLPIIKKQINLIVEDTIDVSDLIAVADQIQVGDNIAVADTIAVSTPSAETIVQAPITSLPQGIYALLNPSGGAKSTQLTIDLPALPAGGDVQQVVWEIDGTIGIGGTGIAADGFTTVGWNFRVDVFDGTAWRKLWATGDAFITPDLQFLTTYYGTRVTVLVTSIRTPDHGFTDAAFFLVNKLQATVRRSLPINKSGQVTKSGGAGRIGLAFKTGRATKIGTVALTGNSSADTVLGRITADVDGLKDDAGGTITALTGGPGANVLLENPADVMYLLMREVFGEKTATRYAASAWVGARAKYAAGAMRWAFAYRGGSFREFRKLAGLQSGSDLFQDGGLWVLAPRVVGTTAMTFAGRNTEGTPTFGWSRRTDLVTLVHGTYDWNVADQVWRKSVDRRATRQQDRYGVRRRQDRKAGVRDLQLPWVRDPGTADVLSTFWLDQWKSQKMVVSLRGAWEALILDKADTVAIDTAAFPLLQPFGNLGFSVRGKRYLLDDRLVELALVEIDQLPTEIQKAAQYYLKRATDRPLSAGYRVLLVKETTKAGGYRVITVHELTASAAYLLGIPSTPTKDAAYRLYVTHEPTFSAAYAIAIQWDGDGAWDSPGGGLFWDGFSGVSSQGWDGGLAWDLAGKLWDV